MARVARGTAVPEHLAWIANVNDINDRWLDLFRRKAFKSETRGTLNCAGIAFPSAMSDTLPRIFDIFANPSSSGVPKEIFLCLGSALMPDLSQQDTTKIINWKAVQFLGIRIGVRKQGARISSRSRRTI